MILPIVGFKTFVLINAPFGKMHNIIGGILMGIQKKFWTGVIVYTILSWCIALYILRVAYS